MQAEDNKQAPQPGARHPAPVESNDLWLQLAKLMGVPDHIRDNTIRAWISVEAGKPARIDIELYASKEARDEGQTVQRSYTLRRLDCSGEEDHYQ